MPTATSRITIASPTITRDVIATNLKTALGLAGYTTLVDDYTNPTTGDRSLVYSITFNTTTHGRIFLENRITTTRIVSDRITTAWDTTTHTPGAIVTAFNAGWQFNALAKITMTSINHPEARLVILEQGISTATVLGIFRPSMKPTWWDENVYPFAWIAQTNTISTFLGFTTATTHNPYATTNNYSPLYISQLTSNAPIANLPDSIAGAAMILPPTTKGWAGIFSNDFALCSAQSLKRLDMLGEFLLLAPGISAIAIRSTVPA